VVSDALAALAGSQLLDAPCAHHLLSSLAVRCGHRRYIIRCLGDSWRDLAGQLCRHLSDSYADDINQGRMVRRMLPQCIGNLAAAVPPDENGSVPWWVGATAELALGGRPAAACEVARAAVDALSAGAATRLPSAEARRVSRSLEKSGATAALCRILMNLVPHCPVEACGALGAVLSARGRGCVPMSVDPLPPEGEVLPVLLPLLTDGVAGASAASLICEILVLPYTGGMRPHALGNTLANTLRVPAGGEESEWNAAISFLTETYLANDLVRVARDDPTSVERVLLSVSEFTFVGGRGEDAEDAASRLVSWLESVWARGVVPGAERMAAEGLLTERHIAGIGDVLAAAVGANFFGDTGESRYAEVLEGGEVSFPSVPEEGERDEGEDHIPDPDDPISVRDGRPTTAAAKSLPPHVLLEDQVDDDDQRIRLLCATVKLVKAFSDFCPQLIAAAVTAARGRWDAVEAALGQEGSMGDDDDGERTDRLCWDGYVAASVLAAAAGALAAAGMSGVNALRPRVRALLGPRSVASEHLCAACCGWVSEELRASPGGEGGKNAEAAFECALEYFSYWAATEEGDDPASPAGPALSSLAVVAARGVPSVLKEETKLFSYCLLAARLTAIRRAGCAADLLWAAAAVLAPHGGLGALAAAIAETHGRVLEGAVAAGKTGELAKMARWVGGTARATCGAFRGLADVDGAARAAAVREGMGTTTGWSGAAVELMGLYVMECCGNGGRGSTTEVISAATSLVTLQLLILSSLHKEISVEYKTNVLSVTLSAMSSPATPAQSSTPSKLRPTLVAERAVLRLLSIVVGVRDGRVTSLLPHVCVLLRDRFIPLGSSDEVHASELLPHLLRLVRRIMSAHWKYFTVTEVVQSPGETAPTNPLAAALRGQRITRIWDNPGRISEFDMIMKLMLDCVRSSQSLPPDVVLAAISALRETDSAVRLFSVRDFAERWRPAYMTAIMEALLAEHLAMLSSDFSKLLYDLARSDWGNFWDSYLSGLIASMPLDGELKENLRQAWRMGGKEMSLTEFCSDCQDFLTEYKYSKSLVS